MLARMTFSASSSCWGASRVTVLNATSACAGRGGGEGAEGGRLIERKQQRLDRLRFVARDGARRIRTVFLDDVGFAQGTLTVAAVDRFAMPQRAAAAQCDNDFTRIVTRERRRRVDLVLHPVGKRENFGITKRVIFQLIERELPTPQRGRDRVGN